MYRAISQNDLWIAAAAVHAELPLLIRNRRHFERIDGLLLEVVAGTWPGESATPRTAGD